jgi:hypothetical protein
MCKPFSAELGIGESLTQQWQQNGMQEVFRYTIANIRDVCFRRVFRGGK